MDSRFDGRDAGSSAVDGVHRFQSAAGVRDDDVRLFLDEQPLRRFDQRRAGEGHVAGHHSYGLAGGR